MVTKNVRIHLQVHNASVINEGYMTVYFDRPIGFEYESGDWIDINFYDGNPRGGITYSLSSSPTEERLAITFKLGISPFKKRLQSLTQGDEMFVSQYGNDYGFHLNQNRSSVLIAGGIGTAPFRSMVREMNDTASQNDVQLIYMSKEEFFVFADELATWQKRLPNLRIEYVETKGLTRKKREKLLVQLIDSRADHFFIAGPEGMVESTEHLLIDDMKINPKQIRIDSFGGY